MNKRWLVCIWLLGCFSLSKGQRYVNNVFSQVIRSTQDYAVKDGDTLRMDIYIPRNDTVVDRPLLVWMHGGGFAGGRRDNGDEVKFMKSAARKGFVAASISYRLLRKDTKEKFGCDCPKSEKERVFKEAAYDFWDALYFLYEKSDLFGFDRQKIIIGGSSAGAEGALTAAYLRKWLFEEGSKFDSIRIKALISLAGAVMDSRYITDQNAVPAILFHGTDDNLVPYGTAPHHYCKEGTKGYIWLDGSHTIAAKLEELDASFLFYTFKGAKHEKANIPFDYQPLIFSFLNEVVVENRNRQLRVVE
ncbi:MAG: alpha/beta hydrolase [Bacteroidota bacterium]